MGVKPEPIIAGRASSYPFYSLVVDQRRDPTNASYSLFPYPVTTVKNEVEVNNFRAPWSANIIQKKSHMMTSVELWALSLFSA
jgi:hypothetical protein